MNNMEYWLPIIISTIVSILGFSVTIFTTYKQFKNSKKDRIIERQSALYLECFKKIESIINSPHLIFDKCYYESIGLFKAEMKLVASNSTLLAYKEYLKFVYDSCEKTSPQPCPNILEIKKQIAKLLNSMRKDLSNDLIESDIIE